ncbi:c-type cytochrome biogenesis protein CcsB [Phytoactinopolyspora alkaliphila]|uniref:C-type cytochrome biogenesis protein CcsB n=1 Tax=Phytoactinopolyspora alkaliphila TaxID=1783498 RepID=A0A6N9YHQ4_9ACTN|nr:c-type cytochrome biogenesis protein CcsB [Phytoactinopolyspora alkaliphila]NED94536.1 c-type cytochrome biogenesis protein CcsB [Phytoactinopolyspora alkaliphila]
MDLDAIAEWSRYVVGAALFVYLGAWLGFSSEMGLRTRLRTEAANVGGVRSGELAAVSAETSVTARTAQEAGDDARPREEGGTAQVRQLAEQADSRGRAGRACLVVATVVLAVGVVMRGVGTGRFPWGNMHEFSITAGLVASIAFIYLGRTAAGRIVTAWGSLIVFITLGLAVTLLYVPPGPLVPALQSYWLIVHVGCAVVAFGLFTVAAVVQAMQIIAERAGRRGQVTGFAASLPASSTLDRLGYRLTAIGFPIWTVGPLILGAIWAEVSWGRYWDWDPKEVWALITWLVYAAYLHARATAGWKGSKASVVGLIGFATALFSYFGVNIFFGGMHVYGGL